MYFTLKFISERWTCSHKEYAGHDKEREKLITLRRVVQERSDSERSGRKEHSGEYPFAPKCAVVGFAY